MSYILEALKKSDAERKRGEVPTLNTASNFDPPPPEQAKSLLPWILSGTLGVVVLGLGGYLVWDQLQSPAPTTKTVAERVAEAQEKERAEQLARDPFSVVTDAPTAPATAPGQDQSARSGTATAPTSRIANDGVGAPAATRKTDLGSQEKPVTLYTPSPSKPTPAPKPEPAPMAEESAAAAQPEPQTEQAPVETKRDMEATEVAVTRPPSPTADDATAPPAPKSAPVEPVESAPATPAPKPKAEPKVIVAKPAEEPKPTKPEATPERKPEVQAVAEPEPVTEPAPKPQTSAERKAAESLVNQAWSSIDKGFYNQAMRDLDTAVELTPGYAEAWFARGWTNEKSGNELSAIGDYARAIKAEPNHAYALFSRAYLNLYVTSPERAIEDFQRTRSVTDNPSLELYTHLWLYLSRMRADQDAQSAFVKDTSGARLERWPGALIHHYLGQMSENQLLSVMNTAEPLQLPERLCTGHFFLGVLALDKGNEDAARQHFEKVLETGAVQFRQFDAAKRELDRLGR